MGRHANPNEYGTSTNEGCEGNDGRLSDARTPTSHAGTHKGGGDDAIDAATGSVDGLMSSGDKTKLDTVDDDADVTGSNAPQGHAASHKGGGSDAIDVATGSVDGLFSSTDKTKLDTVDTDADETGANAPQDHAASHKGGGGDAIDVATGSVDGLLSSGDKTKLDTVDTDADETGVNTPQQHAISDDAVHSGVTGTEGNLVSLDVNKLPQDSGLPAGKILMEVHSSNDTLTAGETGTAHSAENETSPYLTLPASPATGTYFIFTRGVGTLYIKANVQSIAMPWGDVTNTNALRCASIPVNSWLCLYYTGSQWIPIGGRGEWYLHSDATKNYIFEGHVQGAVEGNLATFDAEGNVKDSGAATAAPASGLVARTTDLTLTSAESGKHYVAMTGGSPPVVFTLPPNASAPTGTHYIFERGTANISIVCDDSQLDVPWGTVNLWTGEGLNCDTAGGTIHLIKTATNIWRSFEGTGEWYDRDTPASQRHYDGNVSGSTENNLATFDGGGNLKDSGVGIATIGHTKYDATVGSAGADYEDIQAAITGVGGWDIKLLLVTDVTENSNIDATGINLVIDLSAYILTMGNYSFTCNGGSSIHIFGNGVKSRAEIDYTHTSSVALFTGVTSTSTIRLGDFLLDNNSTAATCPLASSGIQLFDQLKIECANYNSCGLHYAAAGSRWTNIELVGGGTGCSEALKTLTSKLIISNILFSGTFHATSTTILIGQDIIMMNSVFNISTAKPLVTLNDNAGIDGLRTPGLGVDVDMTGTGAFLLNAELSDGDVDVTGNHAHLDNVVSTGALDMDDVTASYCQISNVRFTTALEVAGDKNKISNSDFLGGGTVNSGADDNGFVNCQFGPDSGEGALTLTVVATSNRTRIVGCMTDAAISDSGTGTVEAANTVY